MELNLNNRAIDWIGFAATLAVAIGLGYPLLQGQVTSQRALGSEQQELAVKLADVTEVMNTVAAGQELLTKLQTRNDSLRSLLPPSLQFQEFYQHLSEIATENHIELSEVQPGTMSADPYYVMLPVTITAESSFPNLYAFLSELLAGDRMIKIARFEIHSAEDSDKCSMGLEIMLYSMGEKGAV